MSTSFYVMLGVGLVVAYMAVGFGLAYLVAALRRPPPPGIQPQPLMPTYMYLYLWPLLFVALLWMGIKATYAALDRVVEKAANRERSSRQNHPKRRSWF